MVKPLARRRSRWPWLFFGFSPQTIALALGFVLLGSPFLSASEPSPDLHRYSLPPLLAQWQDKTQSGDYFAEIKTTAVGYLLWTTFPVKIYLQYPTDLDPQSAAARRLQTWIDAVKAAIAQWSVYFPLTLTTDPDHAEITIHYQAPPLGATPDPETGKLIIPRARAAQTRYQINPSPEDPSIWLHRMTIDLTPGRSYDALLGTARHELGHALGIWGHSPLESDALYFSTLSQPAPISARDLNTLQKIYQHPTRLGERSP